MKIYYGIIVMIVGIADFGIFMERFHVAMCYEGSSMG